MPLLLLAAAALLQAPDPCYAAEVPPGRAGCPAWRVLGRGPQGLVTVDPASLHRAGAGFEIVIRFVYPEAAAGEIRSIVTGFRFDCAARTVAIGRGHAYGSDGERLDEEEPREGYTDPAPVPPDAPEAAVLTAYCPG